MEDLEGGTRENESGGEGGQFTDRPFGIEIYEGGD